MSPADRRHAPASGASTPAALAVALLIIERLSRTVEAENADVARGGPVPYEAYSLRKNQALLELNRMSSALEQAALSGPFREALEALAAKLQINRHALGVQLKAAAAVADIIAHAIRDGQSDGTYTALAWSRARE